MSPTGVSGPGRDDGRAVSTVVGVILMVFITLVLAAAIGNFVLAIGENASDTAPSLRLNVDTEASAGDITLSHQGGDDLVGSETAIIVDNETSGASLRFSPSSDAVLTVGDDLRLDLDASPNAVISASSSVWGGTAAAGSFTGVTPRASYTVRVIDLVSDRVVFETTIGG